MSLGMKKENGGLLETYIVILWPQYHEDIIIFLLQFCKYLVINKLNHQFLLKTLIYYKYDNKVNKKHKNFTISSVDSNL